MTERFAFRSDRLKPGVQTAASHRCHRALDVSFVVVFLLEWIFRVYLDRMQLLTCIQLCPDHSRSFSCFFLEQSPAVSELIKVGSLLAAQTTNSIGGFRCE